MNTVTTDRAKRVVKNAIWELGYYLIVIALGFLAPRYIILIYGSEVNGLSSTITQILNIILILQSGTTTAAIFSLYKPIAEDDILEISKNVKAAERYFKRLSYVFCLIMLAVATFTTVLIKSAIEPWLVFIAFVIMGMKSFLDLYFTSKFRIVFTAYQEKFIISIATLIEQVVYYALVFLTLFLRLHFIFIYLWLFIGCLIKVIYLQYKYNKKYVKIIPIYKGKDVGQIKGRSYAFANEVAHSIVASSVAIILSFMYGLSETSVYSVYSLISQALTLIGTSIYSAFAPGFGSLVAVGNSENTKRVFGIFQYIFVMLNTVMYCCMVILGVSFVAIYTSGATDINYANFLLTCIMGLSGIFSAYRIPYNIVVSSCGYFKETWKQPVICVFVAILISFIGGYFDYSLILLGPALFFLINFIYQHLKLRKLIPHLISSKVFLMFFISMLCFGFSVIGGYYMTIQSNITIWLVLALVALTASFSFIIIASLILLPDITKDTWKYIYNHFFRRKVNA